MNPRPRPLRRRLQASHPVPARNAAAVGIPAASGAAGGTGLPTPRRYLASASVSAGTLLLTVDASIASVALPTIAHDLGVTGAAAVLIISTYQLVLAMTILPFSALGDRVGQRFLYRAGMLTYILAATVCFFADSLPALLAVRSLQALGAAASLSVSFGLVRAIYPPSHLGRGLGINTLAAASGGALAPAVGGLILSFASWHWIFVAGMPMALASLLAGRTLPESVPHNEAFDVAGAVLCAATFGLVIFGLEAFIHSHGLLTPLLLLATGIAAGCLFVAHELRQRHPVLPVDLLSHPPFALSVAGSLTGVIGSTTLLLSIPFRLQHGYGFGVAPTGAMVAAYALASLMIAPASGMLSDRISPKILGGFGLAIAIVALVLLAFLPDRPDVFDIAWRMWLCGAGFGMFFSPNARIILGSAPVARAAAGGGLMTTTRLLGQALGATVVGALLASGLGNGPLPALAGAVMTVLASLCSLLRPPHQVPSAAMARSG